MAVHNVLPSTLSNVSASASLNFSRLNIPLRMIAVYASQPSSPATTQHSLEGGSLLPYPRQTFTGWKAPALLGALKEGFESKTGRNPKGPRSLRKRSFAKEPSATGVLLSVLFADTGISQAAHDIPDRPPLP